MAQCERGHAEDGMTIYARRDADGGRVLCGFALVGQAPRCRGVFGTIELYPSPRIRANSPTPHLWLSEEWAPEYREEPVTTPDVWRRVKGIARWERFEDYAQNLGLAPLPRDTFLRRGSWRSHGAPPIDPALRSLVGESEWAELRRRGGWVPYLPCEAECPACGRRQTLDAERLGVTPLSPDAWVNQEPCLECHALCDGPRTICRACDPAQTRGSRRHHQAGVSYRPPSSGVLHSG